MRILIFGDSIVQGSFDTECGGWTNRLAADFNKKAIEQQEYINTHSLGIGGETSIQLVKRIESEIMHRDDPQTVSLVLCGTNDAKWLVDEDRNKVAIEDFKITYKQIVEILKLKSQQVICLGLTRVDESITNPKPPDKDNKVLFINKELERYEQEIKNISEKLEVSYLPIFDVFGVNELSPDGVHPNSEGHRLIYGRVKEKLQEAGIL